MEVLQNSLVVVSYSDWILSLYQEIIREAWVLKVMHNSCHYKTEEFYRSHTAALLDPALLQVEVECLTNVCCMSLVVE
jgi:hypothetical protein